MLTVHQLDKEMYVCNHCGKTFDIRSALLDKGNVYLCSMECVLNYDKEWR